jgi:glutamine synthetase
VVGHGPSLRIECRVPGADANPYLVYAALLAAGLAGVERRIEPGPAFGGDSYTAEGLPRLPCRLHEAIEAFERSELAREAFGEAVIAHYLHFARTEQEAVEARVTEVERERYFERI